MIRGRPWSLIVGVLVLASVSTAVAAPGAAAGFSVNTTEDAQDTNLLDGICKTMLPDNPCTLRAAIQQANAMAQGATTIVIPAGTYTLTVGGADEDMAVTGDLDVRTNVTLLGTVGTTTVVGGPGFGDRIFDIPAGVQPNVTLNGVIVSGGAAPALEDGGGIQVRGGSFRAINVSFSNNTAGGSGGGFYQDAGSADITLATFSGNVAGSNGGGLDLEGSLVVTNLNHLTVTGNSAFQGGGMAAFVTPEATGSIPSLYQSTFTGNRTAEGGAGGGMAVSRMTAVTTIIDGNSASYGGGVELVGSSLPPFLASRVDVLNNSASVNGGGIYATSCSSSCGSLLQVVVEGNTAGRDGSGVYAIGALSVQNTTIDGNSTGGGGAYGGAVFHTGAGPLTLTNMTVGQNHANGPGGGGVVVDASVSDVFTNVTIADNDGGATNGVLVTASAVLPQLRNTVVSSDPLKGANCSRPVMSLGHNLDSGNTCGMTQAGDLTNADARLHPLTDNGGGTWTMKPGEPRSPLIDAGDTVVCPVTDQRSVRRPVDGNHSGTSECDIGAYETGVSALNSDIGFTSLTATQAGSVVTFAMSLKSSGEGAGINSIVTSVLPSSLWFKSCSASGGIKCKVTTGGVTVTVKFPKIEIGAVASVTLRATVVTHGQITNTVRVWSENPDWFPYDNTKAVTFQG